MHHSPHFLSVYFHYFTCDAFFSLCCSSVLSVLLLSWQYIGVWWSFSSLNSIEVDFVSYRRLILSFTVLYNRVRMSKPEHPAIKIWLFIEIWLFVCLDV